MDLSAEEYVVFRSQCLHIDALFRFSKQGGDITSGECFEHLDELDHYVRYEHRTLIRKALIAYILKEHDIFKLFCKFWTEIVRNHKPLTVESYSGNQAGGPINSEAKKHFEQKMLNVKRLSYVLIRLTDKLDTACTEFGERGCLDLLLDTLQHGPHIDYEVYYRMITYLIYNCCRRIQANRDRCRRAVDAIKNLTKSVDQYTATNVYITLAFILGKSSSHKYTLSVSTVKFFVRSLNLSLNDLKHKADGYSVVELMEGVRYLVVDDENKRLFMRHGGLPVIERILVEQVSTDEEKRFAVESIRELAQLDENRQPIGESRPIMKAMVIIRGNTHPGSDIHEAASGALSLIGGHHCAMDTERNLTSEGAAAIVGGGSGPRREHTIDDREEHEQAIYLRKVEQELGKLGFSVVKNNTPESQTKPADATHFGLQRAMSRAWSRISGSSESSGYDEGESDPELMSPSMESIRSLRSTDELFDPFLKHREDVVMGTSAVRATNDEPTTDHESLTEDEDPTKSAEPLEILARGPEARQAYQEAIRNGERSIYRTRLMLVGQDRVGKTSLKKSLTGIKFDPQEPITDGVDTSHLCEINVTVAEANTSCWSVKTDQDVHKKMNETEFNHAVAEAIVDKLLENKTDNEAESTSRSHEEEEEGVGDIICVHLPSECKENQEKEIQASIHPDTLTAHTAQSEREGLSSLQSVKDRQEADPSGFTSKLSIIPTPPEEEMSTKITKLLKEKIKRLPSADSQPAEENTITIAIWDFAGHKMYYTTHQVFLTWRAIYLVVFDLSKDLNGKADEEDLLLCGMIPGGAKCDLTRLEFINFWLSSIVSHACPPIEMSGRSQNQRSPPIIIVGTHRDSIPGSEREKKIKVKQIFDKIRRSIQGKIYQHHVIPQYFDIENSLGAEDTKLQDLQKFILKVASEEPYMGEKIPLRWLKFEELKSVEKKPMKNMGEIKELTASLSIGDDLPTMLRFYHDLGRIVYFGGHGNDSSPLKDLVILDPQWLIDVFKQVITVVEPEDMTANLIEAWDNLQDNGLLEQRLISHVWQRFSPEEQQGLIDLMKKFDLISDAQMHDGNAAEHVQLHRQFFVPSLFKHRCPPETIDQLNSLGSLVFFMDIDGDLTIGLFHRLMSRMSQKHGHVVKLFYRQILMPLTEGHRVLIEMIPPPSALIKVAVYRATSANKRRGPTKPDPKVMKLMMTDLETVLQELCHDWIGKEVRGKFLFKCLEQECETRMSFIDGDRKPCLIHENDIEEVRLLYGLNEAATIPQSESSSLYFDIFLDYSCESEDVRKIKTIIHRNSWKMITAAESKLGVPAMQSRAQLVEASSHVIVVITEDDCVKTDAKQTMTLEMAFESSETVTGRCIPIICCEKKVLPLQLRTVTIAHVDDDNLEQRLKDTIDIDIRLKKERAISK